MIRPIALLFIVVVAVVASARSARAQDKPTPPSQPTTGPGSSDYKHKQVVAHMYGMGATRYWIFEPADPTPEGAPLIVFNHGWSAMEPKAYGAWIDHIVKRGNIVVFPVYQDSLRTPTANFTPNAAAGIQQAVERLKGGSHVRPDLDKVAFVGHSMGGVISANLAARWQALGVPQPKAVMCVEPGKTWTMSDRTAVTLEDLSFIDKNTLLLAVAGDRDRLVKDVDAKRIFKESTQVLVQNKNYVVLVSDDHGEPSLVANHIAPCAPNFSYVDPSIYDSSTNGPTGGSHIRERLREAMQERREQEGDESPEFVTETSRGIDALDFYGTWKLFDGLCDAAFYGTNRDFALGNTARQRFMGKWSDGTPVKELQVTVTP